MSTEPITKYAWKKFRRTKRSNRRLRLRLRLRLLRPRRPGSAALVLLPRDGEDCELLIRAGVARLQWMGWPGCRLVCLNPGEDPNVEAICNIFQRRYPNLELCKCSELVYDKENEKS